MTFDVKKLAEEIKVSHTAVSKWEEYDQERAKIDIHVEIMLRSLIKLKLNEESDFSNFYRGLIDDVRKLSDETSNEPMIIAG